MSIQPHIREQSSTPTVMVVQARRTSVRRAKKLKFVALLLALGCGFSSACTAWHTTSLEPQRFSADTSPARVRLTLNGGGQLMARHPVMVGDSLVWTQGASESPRDSARGAVLVSSIQKVEVNGADAPRSIGLLLVLGGVAAGIYAILHSIAVGLAGS